MLTDNVPHGAFSMHPKSDDENTRVSLVIKGLIFATALESRLLQSH